VNQLASGLRRAHDLIEELGRRENFYLDLAGGASGRAAGTVFHYAHLAYKLPRANRAKEDALAIEFPEYLNSTAEKAKNMVRRVSLSKKDFPFSEVRANHRGPLNQQPVAKLDDSKLACHIRAGADASHGYAQYFPGIITSSAGSSSNVGVLVARGAENHG
jgi:hypothetical protein